MKKNVALVWGSLSIVASLLFSCQKNNVEPPKPVQKDAVYRYIQKLGYDVSEIKDLGDMYVVDGDIIFRKDLSIDPGALDGPHTEQYSTGNLVGYNEQPNIVIFLDPSVQAFEAEINAGVAMINNIPNCRINITTSLSRDNRDITITDAVLDNCGLGSYPTNGRPGPEIFIDLIDARNYTLDQWKYLIVHQIGHCLGLRHTNWIPRQEAPEFTDPYGAATKARHILGTPTGEDPLSVMNDGTCGSSAQLSDFDILALQILYPENAQVPLRSVPVFRYHNNSQSKDHVYTRNYAELGDGSNDGYHFEGIAFYAFATQAANTVPVHRFLTPAGSHFYCVDAAEAPAGSTDQGVAFFAYASAVNGALPVYRYFNAGVNDWLFTKNEDEVLFMPGYNQEAVAWFAY